MIKETLKVTPETKEKIKVEIPFDTSSDNDESMLNKEGVEEGLDGLEEEESHSSNNSPSPTISMESQQMISSDETTKKESPSPNPSNNNNNSMSSSSDENPILNILRDSINRNGMNDQSRELLFQLGRHLMNLASESDTKTAHSGDEEHTPMVKSPFTRGNQKYSAFYKKTKASPESKTDLTIATNTPMLAGKNIHETYFQCSCNEEFENLYIFTIHMRDTGHKPKASSAEKDIPKLVRGQDMWINSETEQTKEILRCMHCQQSFRSLPDLTMHMIKTNHYSEIVYQDGNIIKNGGSDTSTNGGRNGTKKVSPEKNSLKRKSEKMAKDESPERKTSKAVLRGLDAKRNNNGGGGENPLSSLQKLVNIQNDEKVINGQKRSSPLHTEHPPKSSFLDLFYQLEQIKNYDPQTDDKMARQSECLDRKTPNHPTSNMSQTASLTKKAKCHFCGKPFANKGQVRLHISKNKCPSLLQKNCQTTLPNKTTSKRISETEKSPTDVQFTNPHLNAAFNLLQRQFPDESKQNEKECKKESVEVEETSRPGNGQEKVVDVDGGTNPLLANLNQFNQFMTLFQMLMPANQNNSNNIFDSQNNNPSLASLLPFLAMTTNNAKASMTSNVNQTPTLPNSAFPLFPFHMNNLSATSVTHQTNNSNSMTNQMSDFSLDRYIALARQLSADDNHIVTK